MIIKKFNSLFHKHARVLSAIFAVIIIIAFMDFLTPGRGGCSFFQSNKVGSAFGKNVTIEDLQKLQEKVALFAHLSGGNAPQIETRELFQIYCGLKRAEQLGITVSSKEVAALMTKCPVFQVKGQFDEARYQEFLEKGGVSEENVEETLRVVLTLQKMSDLATGSPVVTDHELEVLYRAENPVLTVKVLSFKAADFSKDVPVPSDDVLKKFREENPDLSVAPATFDALLVKSSPAAFLKEAETEVTDAYLEKFIAEHGAEFGITGTLNADQKTQLRPLLALDLANRKAQKTINDFAKKCYEQLPGAAKRDEKLKLFQKLAAEAKLEIVSCRHVAFDSKEAAKIPFATTFHEMPLDAETPMTRPMRTQEGYMVGYLLGRTEKRNLSFEEAKPQLLTAYRERESLARARKAAAAGAERIQKTAPAARSAEFAKLGKSETITLSIPESMKLNDEAQAAMFYFARIHTEKLKAGEFSPALDTPDGARLIEVVFRKPADMADFPMIKDALRRQLLEYKANEMALELRRTILTQCQLFSEQAPEK